jgi:hypothetical protein
MNKPTTAININYDEAIFLSTAIIHTLRKLRQSHTPEIIQKMFPNADFEYLIGQVQIACELLEE